MLKKKPRSMDQYATYQTAWMLAVLLVLATTISTWYLVGDLSVTKPNPSVSYSYTIDPVNVPQPLEHTVGILALIAFVGSTVGLYMLHNRDAVHYRHWIVVSLLAPAGLIFSISMRSLTAGTVDANIGAGMAALFGLPAAGLLLLICIVSLFFSFRGQ